MGVAASKLAPDAYVSTNLSPDSDILAVPISDYTKLEILGFETPQELAFRGVKSGFRVGGDYD
jgi:hypothetical protein